MLRLKNALAFPCILLLSSTLWGQSSEEQNAAEAELESVSSALEEISSWLIDANSQASETETTLQLANTSLSEITQSITSIQESVDNTQARIDELQQRNNELESEKQQRTEVIHSILRAIYIQGSEPPLKQLLDQDSSQHPNRLQHYSSLISQAQMEQIEEYENLLAELVITTESLNESLNTLNTERSALASEQLSLRNARDQQQSALEDLRNEISSQNRQRETLEINQAELQQLIEEIRIAMEGVRSFEDVPPFVDSRGQLPPPVSGSISNRFGESYGGGSLVRQGITLSVERGSAVRSIHAGHVVFADWLRGSGLLVIIDHGDGYMSLYGGNEALAISAGNWVDAGDVLATSGSAINSDGPSLYFEIRQHGQAQNPANWLNLN